MDPSARPLRDWLARAGPTRASALRVAFGLSQSTFQRRIASLADDLLVVGRARATTYALRREVEGLRTPVHVFEGRPEGTVRRALTLHPVEPMGCWVESHCADVPSDFHETDPRRPSADPAVDLPWFLLDLKPVGYLGRSWARAHPDLGFGPDPSRWSGDAVLRYAALHGVDGPGAFLIGEAARDRVLEGALSRAEIDRRAVCSAFPELVQRAHEGWRGSSTPGGEQPKFAVTLRDADSERPCLVKFSPPRTGEVGARWADLLLVEHLVHELLAELGVSASRSFVVDDSTRRHLVVERFDRSGAHGRVGVCSLASLDVHGVAGELRSWSAGVGALEVPVPDGALDQVAWLEAFGHAIANSDMHPGNLAFILDGARVLGLAPVYDMLPMFHAPRFGEVLDAVYDPAAVWDRWPPGARDAARELWSRVIAEPRVSDRYRELARRQAAVLG